MSLDKALDKEVSKGRLALEEKMAVMRHVRTVDVLEDLGSCSFIIEAIKEDLATKQHVLHQMSCILKDKLTEADYPILASNTSSISITKLAACTSRPDRVIGMHFMNPVPRMLLVEVIPGLDTSSDTLNSTLGLAKLLKKTTTLSRDVPGFIANRCLMPYINEAIFSLYEVKFQRLSHVNFIVSLLFRELAPRRTLMKRCD